ncbi:MAG TPA: P1 family peptidase [Anaerolineaceae bacterium]|jgi:L-aminopeptidase/D-esterase-like protein|nr:P1 family peptidase [Longilinea sp.]HOD03569.1 P1 family peptidase [Anaerolineaceae bacterium]HOG79675.1 P1 family peptidase [Anaerolineaceae bacterium]HQF62929.1 P1 family peptidase [Anaerolineaceae bacterium]HQH85976.1 P1 family peptidase [Anaerolineaceae bacterium]
MELHNAITDVPGIRVGHAQNLDALTGCTVVLCESGAVGGVDQRGGAPGTRETDALRPMHLVDQVHGVLLTGGSAFGLDAASGVMRYLEERGVGFNTGVAKVPIVPAAVLFDLAIGRADIRPDAAMGYEACQNASNAVPAQGNVGAGTGATVGKVLGPKQAMKSGIGTASMDIGGGIIVGAIVAVNAFGDVVDPENQHIIAGARSVSSGPIKIGATESFADTLQTMKTLVGRVVLDFAGRQNTVIGVVATNARLSKEEVNKVAQMAHNGLALSLRPAHTMMDGDTIFALATGQRKADVNIVGAFAAQVTAQAIIQAVKAAQPAGGLPAASA